MKKELSQEVYKNYFRHAYQERRPDRESNLIRAKKPSSWRKCFTRHPYAYYNQFKPIIFVLRIFGEYKSSVMSWSMVYCVMSYGLQSYIAVIVCFRRVQALIDSRSEYDEFIFSIHVLAYLNIHFHVPFTYWLQNGRLSHYLKLWANFQDEWESTLGEPFVLHYSKAILIYTAVIIPSILMFLVFEHYSTLHDPLVYFTPYFMTLVSTALILGLWFGTCLEIRRISFELSNKLIEHLDGKPTTWFMFRWRLLWLDLRKLTESLATDLSAVVLSIMLTFSTTFLLGVYNGLVQLITHEIGWKALGYLMASTTSLSIIYVLCDGGHKATSGVISNTLSSLLKGKLSRTNEELRYQIYMVLETIKADTTQMKLGGFVTMNRRLVVSLVSNTLTYLIVLLQFKVNETDKKQR